MIIISQAQGVLGKNPRKVSDPCSILSGNSAVCIDTIGSFNCTCQNGFESVSGGITCEDINECSDAGTCPENSSCSNTVGAFDCNCNSGFSLDGNTCADDDECANSDPCNIQQGNAAICNNVVGSFNCTCQAGFLQDQDELTCSDIDECSQAEVCGDNSVCSNTNGSFICSCQSGFQPDAGDQLLIRNCIFL